MATTPSEETTTTKPRAPRRSTATKGTAAATTATKDTAAKGAAATRTAAKGAARRTRSAASAASTAPTRARRAAAVSASSHGFPGNVVAPAGAAAHQVVGVASMPMTAARRVLDRRGGLPVYVGAGALAVVGAIEWPVAVGVGAGYAALRRWGAQLPEPLRSLTGSAPHASEPTTRTASK